MRPVNQAVTPKLSILIATVGERDKRFRRLVNQLKPQVQRLHGQVEVLVYWNNFESSIARIRQKLVDEARGKYICFIDDDDAIPSYYCDRILNALKINPDYVGWKMQCWFNGEKMKPTFHSIEYKSWSDNSAGYYRNISHLNPVKRSIALMAEFDHETGPEDYSWAQRVAPFVNTEYYIEECMYNYFASTADSVWNKKYIPRKEYVRPPLGNYFRYHPDSKVIHTCASLSPE